MPATTINFFLFNNPRNKKFIKKSSVGSKFTNICMVTLGGIEPTDFAVKGRCLNLLTKEPYGV